MPFMLLYSLHELHLCLDSLFNLACYLTQNFGCDQIEAFAEDNLSIAKMMISLFERVENTVGKGENAGYRHFLHFWQYFPKPFS